MSQRKAVEEAKLLIQFRLVASGAVRTKILVLGCSQVAEVLPDMHGALVSVHTTTLTWHGGGWCLSIIPALRRRSQEDQQFSGILIYTRYLGYTGPFLEQNKIKVISVVEDTPSVAFSWWPYLTN